MIVNVKKKKLECKKKRKKKIRMQKKNKNILDTKWQKKNETGEMGWGIWPQRETSHVIFDTY